MSQDPPLRIGVIGCGNISSVYLKNLTASPWIDLQAVSDLDLPRAKAKAAEFGISKALHVDEMLDDPDIELVVNLTVPDVHAHVTLKSLYSGKHVYSEKPLATTREDGREILNVAESKGLEVGSAPDTFLGTGIQTCKRLMKDARFGQLVAIEGFMLCRGHESWHPSPEFYYQRGGGPMFDMGPYYLTAMIALAGPLHEVSGHARISYPERLITSAPKSGQMIRVETPTHIVGTMDFASGIVGSLTTSFDVWPYPMPHIVAYGSEGTILVPDPNGFGGPVMLRHGVEPEFVEVQLDPGFESNSRGIGIVEMADAIRSGRKPLASGALAFHVLDVMEAFLESADAGRRILLEDAGSLLLGFDASRYAQAWNSK